MNPFRRAYLRFSDRVYNLVTAPLRELGDIIIFFFRVFRTIPGIPRSMPLILQSMLVIGVRSLPIVFVISVFAGATTTWQANYQLQEYVTMRYLGTAVSKSIILELGPVLTGLVVAGRVGASIAASLGAMRVTEQIDALSTMAIDPVRYLVLPRMSASVVMVPMLTIFACFFGIVGGWFTATRFLGISSGIFVYGLRQFFYFSDIAVSLIKALVFGTGLSLLGCFYGFNATGGAEGVGQAAIKAYVTSAVFILLSDFAVASIAF